MGCYRARKLGGGGGSRTRVRKYSTAASTYIAFALASHLKSSKGRISQALSCSDFTFLTPGRWDRLSYLNDAFIWSDRKNQEDVSRLTRLKRTRNYLRLSFSYCLTRPVGTSVCHYSFAYPRRNRDAPLFFVFKTVFIIVCLRLQVKLEILLETWN